MTETPDEIIAAAIEANQLARPEIAARNTINALRAFGYVIVKRELESVNEALAETRDPIGGDATRLATAIADGLSDKLLTSLETHGHPDDEGDCDAERWAAAREIRALTAQVANLHELLQTQSVRLTAHVGVSVNRVARISELATRAAELQAERRMLRHALKPFAREAENWHEMGDTRSIYSLPVRDQKTPTAGDLRNARDAFEACGGEL